MKSDFRLQKTSYSRCRSPPMQVSTMMLRPPALTTKPWKLMIMRPSAVAVVRLQPGIFQQQRRCGILKQNVDVVMPVR